ncbi:MAG: DUF445 family protein [Firmicutes bacterium]|nr:DUF445 family protein [Bacillota bacterium]
MNWEKLLVSALVGAAIGYITNWIAIKMLFRPLNAKRLLGIRLPFTPGVIPKEKDRLARSIGDSVSRHLLTREYISGELLSGETEEQVRSLVRRKVSEAHGKTVQEVLEDAGIDFTAREKCQKTITAWFLKGVRDRRLLQLISTQLSALIVQLLERHPAELVNTGEFSACRNQLQKLIKDFFAAEENRRQLQDFLAVRVERVCASTGTIKEYIPGNLLDDLREYMAKQAPHIISLVNSYLDAPETRKLLAKRVEGFFDQGLLHRMMGGLLDRLGNNSGQVADKIVDEIANFFAQPENQNLLVQKVESMFNDFLDRRVCDVAAKVDDETRKKTILELSEWLSNKLSCGETVLGVFNVLEKKLAGTSASWRELLGVEDREKFKQDTEAYLMKVLCEIITRSEFEASVAGYVHKTALWLGYSRIDELWPRLSSKNAKELEENVLGVYRGFVDRFLPDILNFVNFSQLITRRVDDLDVLEVEELVIGIMRRELVAITWLGAILGACIGISMVVLQQFI